MKKLRIDIVSDVVCPWCIVGFKRLSKAMESFAGEVEFDVHWQPFELNPQMGPEGENLREHIMRKYGSSAEDSDRARENLTNIGKGLDFPFNFTNDMRIVNTYKAHQLLHWAADTSDKQTDLKLALFEEYFLETKDVSDVDILMNAVRKAGLDEAEARQVLADKTYDELVRHIENQWTSAGISGVPAVILQERLLVTGAQESEMFKAAIQQALDELVA